MSTTAVILAAGAGARFGGQKLLAPLDGVPLIARVLAVAAHLPTVVVGAPELEPFCANARFVENIEPERGMTHSLRLANRTIDESEALLVLLADMPYLTRATIDAVLAGRAGADVAYPIRDGVGGHPVYFSPRARRLIAELPEGDTLRQLRDDPGLTRRAIPIDDDGAYRDVDRPADLRDSQES